MAALDDFFDGIKRLGGIVAEAFQDNFTWWWLMILAAPFLFAGIVYNHQERDTASNISIGVTILCFFGAVAVLVTGFFR